MKTLLAAALAALMLQSPAKPADYSGQWKLDPARSRNLPGFYAEIASHTLDVTQTSTHLGVGVVIELRDARQDTLRFDYALDGSEVHTRSPVRTPQGRVYLPITLKARMDDAGVVHITIDRQLRTPAGPRTLTGTEEWRLSPDGATLTVRRLDETPQGRIDTDMVFVRR